MREWRNLRRTPKADHRVQWSELRDEQTNYSGVRVNNENWLLNQFNSQGKVDFAVQLFKSVQEIAILWRNSSILNNKSKTTRVASAQRSRESKHSWWQIKEIRQEQDSDSTLDQDFVAPAPYHIPIEVVSVRVREHPHRERTPSGVVSWTVEDRERCADRETQYPRVWANDHHWRANHVLLQGKNDSSIQLDNSSTRLPFRGGIIQSWTTNQQRPESTFDYRGKPRNRDRFNEFTCMVTRARPFHWSRFIYFVSSSRVRLWSLSYSAIIWMAKVFGFRHFLIPAKDFVRVAECNREVVAPALCYILLWAAGLFTSFVAPALRENAVWSCVLGSSRQRYSRHSEAEWENERERVRDKMGELSNFRGRPKADQRAQ